MIRNISIRLLGVCFFLLLMGTITGWLIAEDLAGENQGFDFLQTGMAVSLLIFIVQSVLYFLAGKRLFLQLLFLTAGTFSMVWFMFNLFFPLFWVDSIAVEIKILMGAGLLVLSTTNCIESFKKFDEKWTYHTCAVREAKLAREGKLINWGELIRSMDLSVEIYIPYISPVAKNILPILMVASMLLGFFLKNLFPIFSAFAWGIPSALVVSLLFQVAGYNAAQACRVKYLEGVLNLKLEHKKD